MKFYPKELQKVTYADVIAGYTGRKKRSYYNASLNLKQNGYNPKYAVVSMFVKPDRYPSGDCPMKDPRAIQYRKIEYNLELGSYIKPFEHEIYSNVHYNTVSRTRVIAKGLNNSERAELLLQKIEHFRKPVYILLDHSRFDSTINQEHLKSTHRKYNRAFRSRKLVTLLRSQLVNTGYSKNGIKYRTQGTRMSGDPDTGCGNSVVNADCLYGFLTRSGIEKYDFLLDGDDSVVVIEQDALPRLDTTYFGRVGFDTKIQIVRDIDEVEFCQCKLVLTGKGILFSRNPTRAMSHAMVSRRRFEPATWRRWVAGVGACEAAANPGVPVLQEFGDQLQKLSNKPFFDDDLAYRLTTTPRWGHEPVTEDARITFALAWGISPQMQMVMELHNFTSCSYMGEICKLESDIKFKTHYVRAWASCEAIQSGHESLAECSGSSWWSCRETRAQLPGPGCHQLL